MQLEDEANNNAEDPSVAASLHIYVVLLHTSDSTHQQ
jgi:hypothetical protein